MRRLIDANVLKESVHAHDYVLKDCLNSTDKGMFTVGIMQAIDEQPTIDAEPVRHGKWIDIDEQIYTWKVRCSCCGHERSMMSTQGNYPNYCEACGARMDK